MALPLLSTLRLLVQLLPIWRRTEPRSALADIGNVRDYRH